MKNMGQRTYSTGIFTVCVKKACITSPQSPAYRRAQDRKSSCIHRCFAKKCKVIDKGSIWVCMPLRIVFFIIMAELNQQDIPLADFLLHRFKQSFIDKRFG